MIEAIEKLRGLKTFGSVKVDGDLITTNMLMACATMGEINEIADEIEREIEANYLEAPIDYDGLPIKPGHQVELDGKGGEVWLIGCRDVMCDDGMSYTASALTHAKPDPLFDTLALLENGEISIDEATKRIRETLEVRDD